MNMFESNNVKFKFQSSAKQFELSVSGLPRVIFGNLALNFRMTHLSLKNDRIRLGLPRIDTNLISYPLRLCGMGSVKVLPMADISGQVCVSSIGNSVLITYLNDCGETLFSPDNAVTLTMTSIPGIEKSIFFHNRSNEFQHFDCEGLWWSQAVFVNDCTSELMHDWGMLTCWKYADGLIGGILPVTVKNVLGRLRGYSDGLSAIACTGHGGEDIREYPIALLSFGRSTDEVVDSLLDAQHKLNPNFKFREEKTLPEPFGKLGWCSWNAFGRDVNDKAIRNVVGKFRNCNIPVRYIIIDDGWLDTSVDDGKKISEGISNSGLKSLRPNAVKFPFGMQDLVGYCKKNGIESVGLWHTLNGYWDGIANNFQSANDCEKWFINCNVDRIIPSKTSRLFAEWFHLMLQWGIDFVKIDNQAFHRRMLPYSCNIADYMANLQFTLNKAANETGMTMLYCMATHPEIYLNCCSSHLLRISNDFKPNDVFSARKHLVNNFYNSFWLGKILWPDFDMFQSCDINSATFARMLAVSGSPIYITDKPGCIDSNIIHKLVLPDGSIPHFEKLARPMESRFFANPYVRKDVLTAITGAHNVAICGIFNVQEDGSSCSGEIGIEEFGFSPKCLVYSNACQFAPFVADVDAKIPFMLKHLDSDLISVAPITNDFAVIGNIDYFAAPAIIDKIKNENGILQVLLRVPGTVLVYSENQPTTIRCDNQELQLVEKEPKVGQYAMDGNIFKICTIGNTFQIETRKQ